MKWLLLLALLVSGCKRLPESYPVPEQRSNEEGPEPSLLDPFVALDDRRVNDYLVSDFLPAPAQQSWRWTGPKPVARLHLKSTQNLQLVLEYTLPEHTHKNLLPITVKLFLNDKPFGEFRADKLGPQRFTKPVPPEMLEPEWENLIRLEPDKVYIAPDDQAKLGLIISGIGFQERK